MVIFLLQFIVHYFLDQLIWSKETTKYTHLSASHGLSRSEAPALAVRQAQSFWTANCTANCAVKPTAATISSSSSYVLHL